MTPKEALTWCEQFTDNLVMVDVDTKKRTLGLQAMRTCKSALEKQIPKKPLVPWDSLNKTPYCPNCEESVWGCDAYCEHCGQALLWESEE